MKLLEKIYNSFLNFFGDILVRGNINYLDNYDIKITNRKVLFMKKRMITPNDFVNSKLDMPRKSKSVTDRRIQKIKTTIY